MGRARRRSRRPAGRRKRHAGGVDRLLPRPAGRLQDAGTRADPGFAAEERPRQAAAQGLARDLFGGMMATQTGKRYVCETCGSEMLVTKAGQVDLSCCGKLMQPKPAAGSSQK